MLLIMKKIKDLKVGDAVVVYQEYNERYTPNQREVVKIGRTKIHVKCQYSNKTEAYSIETGCGEYDYRIYPGNMEEFLVFKEEKTMWKGLRQDIATMYNKHLTKDQMERIINILNEE